MRIQRPNQRHKHPSKPFLTCRRKSSPPMSTQWDWPGDRWVGDFTFRGSDSWEKKILSAKLAKKNQERWGNQIGAKDDDACLSTREFQCELCLYFCCSSDEGKVARGCRGTGATKEHSKKGRTFSACRLGELSHLRI